MMKPPAVLLYPAGDVNYHPFDQCVHIWMLGARQALSPLSRYRSTCVQVALFLLIHGPKHKSSDAGIQIRRRETIKCFLSVKRGMFLT